MAPPEDLPQSVLTFLDTCIDSVEQLRVLLLLHDNPERDWTVSEITAELRSTDTSIAKRLDDLYSRNVLARASDNKDVHRFNPASDEARAVIDELVEQNHHRPFRVIEAIYSRPSKVLQQFADSFKLRGDK